MKTLRVEGIRFENVINPRAPHLVFEKLRNFSHTFTFGQSYLLDSGLGEGGWALSWIIGGEFDSKFGTIICDHVKYPVKQRKKDAWCVRHSNIKTRRFSLHNSTSAQEQIQYGLRTVSDQYLKTEQEIIDQFHLTPERYNRPLRQLSLEGWRASCAIGIANGKKIFCFPYMDPEYIENYRDMWLKEMLELLKASGALVLFPARAKRATIGLCDEVVEVG